MGKVRFEYFGSYNTDGKLCFRYKTYDSTPSGDYWPDADYEALEAENERLRGVLSEVTADTVYSDNEALQRKLAALVKVSEAVREYLMGGIWVYDKSPDEFIKAALEASDG